MNIGIIGGSDGPTTVLIYSSSGWLQAVGAAAFVALCIIVFFIWRKNSQGK